MEPLGQLVEEVLVHRFFPQSCADFIRSLDPSSDDGVGERLDALPQAILIRRRRPPRYFVLGTVTRVLG